MTSTETKITFETLPQAVEEIKVELTHLKGTVERLLELSSGTQRDSWMNITKHYRTIVQRVCRQVLV